MSTLALLREDPSRRALRAITHQIGYGTLARAGAKAAIRSRLNRAELPRQFFLSLWDTLGQREAIVDGDRRITFTQFKDRVLRLADGLHQLGLREGDACAELLYNCSHWFELNLACALTGMAMPMLNWHLRPQELVDCIQRANAKVLVVDSSFAEMVAKVRDQIPGVERVLLTGSERLEGFDSFEELIQRSAPRLPPGHFSMSSKPYSGGTTGTPKYINLNQEVMFGESDTARRGVSREQITRLTLMQASAFDWYGLGECHDAITGNARSLIPGPLYHAGVQIGVLPFFFGGTVVPMHKFTAEGFLKAIQDERINWTFVAPTMLERVVALPDEVKNKYNLASMRTI
ncbi:AMP-binding protein, partial [Candidatus Macondimonas diazotrophica]|nr:AMP-binding protein [Candidatus Macondimonas diazotrophica]